MEIALYYLLLCIYQIIASMVVCIAHTMQKIKTITRKKIKTKIKVREEVMASCKQKKPPDITI